VEINRDLAEFIGVLLGDGYISRKYNRIKITLNFIDDLAYLNYIKNLVIKLFKVKPIIKKRKNENAIDLFIFNQKIINILINKIGLMKSPKWNRAIIPSSALRYDKEVIRGYFDTDGCLSIVNNNGVRYPRIEMKVMPSPMQNQFLSILNKYGFKFGAYQIGKGKIRVQINGKRELKKWDKIIGSNNQKNISRINSFLNENVAESGLPRNFRYRFEPLTVPNID